MLPWFWDDLEQLNQFFGGDGWPYGLEPNRPNLETLMDHLVEQGLMKHRVPLEELFLSLKNSYLPQGTPPHRPLVRGEVCRSKFSRLESYGFCHLSLPK